MTTYEKIVKGATKIKVAAPKPKYIEPILMSTSRKEDFRNVMNYLRPRLQDSAWSIVYKSLIVLHIMIREGERNVTLDYLADRPEYLEINKIASNNPDSRSLSKYARYLAVRAQGFADTEVDYVRDEQLNNSSFSRRSENSGGRLRNLSIEKGLLKEVESVERQIESLLRCKFQEVEVNNDIILTTFRLLVHDLLALYQSLNEGVINILEHYFEMGKPEAAFSLKIYKRFVKLTADVVSYLRTAKHLEYVTKLHVPVIKHAPTALADSLEEYLNDKDFETIRKQYLAEKDSKDSKGSQSALATKTKPPSSVSEKTPKTSRNSAITQPAKSPAASSNETASTGLVVQTTGSNPFAHLIQTQQMQLQPAVIQPVVLPQQTSFVPQQQPQILGMNPGQQVFAINQQQQQFPVNPQQFQQQQVFNGMQQVPQQSHVHNPFAQTNPQLQPLSTGFGFGNVQATSNMMGATLGNITENAPLSVNSNITGSTSSSGTSLNRSKSVNPFSMGNYTTGISSSSAANNPFSANGLGRSSSMKVMPTGSNNPFSSNNLSAITSSSTNNPISSQMGTLKAQPTGHNPFSAPAQTQQQALMPQPTFGGLENLPTVPVFPDTQRDLSNQMALNNAQAQLNQNKQQMIFQQTGQTQVPGQQFNGFNQVQTMNGQNGFATNQFGQISQQQPAIGGIQHSYMNHNVSLI
ncbi:Yap1801 protein [Saccharomycopsis crataegensis]|uniref:Yap1801 protein n=1 Tax=Saccharomycopsis crataegensis TaxID=43959 RepID=A0AAV5QNV3_9ASCO|nr:Yap1801 protein [Saccharomycopsis crataegensis]